MLRKHTGCPIWTGVDLKGLNHGLHLEIVYFEEAVDFLLAHPQIETEKGVGVCGISKGASIALAMAATISRSKLGAIAAINGPIYSTMVSMNYKGN